MRLRSWLSELTPLTRAWSSLTEFSALFLARYMIAVFTGVVATVAWQSYHSGTKEETVAAPAVTATEAALDSMRQSIDKLAAQITRVEAVEQDILERISVPPPQPVASPARNPAQRPSPVR
jgi:hypothetical protein